MVKKRKYQDTIFQSTPSARRATFAVEELARLVVISIHALREEGDAFTSNSSSGTSVISIHALREEGDRHRTYSCVFHEISIHALREEGDRAHAHQSNVVDYFNPRPPRGGRREARARQASALWISIHALREEGDSKSGEKIHHVCSIIHTCAQFEKELYEGSGEMQNKSC